MKSLVVTQSLTKSYPAVTALDDCTLTVAPGEVFGLLGPNGAGKTTLLRLILGFLKPTSGSASIQGLDCYYQRVAAHRYLSYLPGDARLFRTMRGRHVLKFFGEIRPDANLQRSVQLAERLELDLSRWVAFMSTGMRQKLALAVSLSIDAPLTILDEPTANLDPNVRGEVMQMVAEARTMGRTVIFSSHVLSEVEDACDRVAILRAGKLVHLQSMSALKRQHRIRARSKASSLEVPDSLKQHMTLSQIDEEHIQIETPDEISSILSWLAQARLKDVCVEPVGLRAVYDRFHKDIDGGAA